MIVIFILILFTALILIHQRQWNRRVGLLFPEMPEPDVEGYVEIMTSQGPRRIHKDASITIYSGTAALPTEPSQ